MPSKFVKQAIITFWVTFLIAGCGNIQNATSILESTSTPQASSIPATAAVLTPSPIFNLSKYSFPETVDPIQHYLFYLHGKIIEDQGIPAISPEDGEYEYQAILEKLSSYGFLVISEQRAKNTDSLKYAKRVSEQITALLNSGVPANEITIVGASKGAGITILVSHLLQNEKINYVIMAICDPTTVKELKQNETILFGNVLSIYDSADELAGSCQDLFSFSEGKGISKHNEIVLTVGTGHGVLYQPLDEWILPAIQWAGIP